VVSSLIQCQKLLPMDGLLRQKKLNGFLTTESVRSCIPAHIHDEADDFIRCTFVFSVE
jgi:hypothetical protein